MSRPVASVVPSLDGDVLMVLSRTTRPLSGREISRLVGRASQTGVQKVLRRLADHGLVTVQEAAVALLYVLNREHVAAPAVLALADLRAELFRRIREQIAHWPTAAVSVSVFGSAARGDGDVDSDVDVFIVRPDQVEADDPGWREQISELADAIAQWTGNRASMIEASVQEAVAMSERQEPIADELVRDAIPLAGVRIAEILAGEDRMSPRRGGRTDSRDRKEARVRLEHAIKYREVAELVATEGDAVPASASVGAGLAVLAGIAAADAACCAALLRRSRAQDHKQAVALLSEVQPGGRDAARHLERLLDLKDTAHYGVIHITAAGLRGALRHADHIVTFARETLAQ